VQACLASGRGALVIAPDQRDVDRLDTALTAALGPDRHVSLTAALGPAPRYRRFLALRRGQVRAVVGTRAAAFAPVRDLGLVVCWDDGDDLLAEPRAPYPHTRDVLVLRAHQRGAAALIGGHAVTVEAAELVERGWAHPLAASRATVRSTMPRVAAVDDEGRRLPRGAFDVVRGATGPVLVLVPRTGYEPGLRCARCGVPGRCAHCSGSLLRTRRDAPPSCGTCGRELRVSAVGQERTAEELGRAFPGLTVTVSGGERILTTVPDQPGLVIATPGAEPVCAGVGYDAALLLDGARMLGRTSLRAGEEALRRWLTAAALVRPGGRVLLSAPPEVPAVQALVRWDPVWAARRERIERIELDLPPATRMAIVDGPVGEALSLAGNLVDVEVLGPVAHPWRDGEPGERVVLRVPRDRGLLLATGLAAAVRERSSHKAPPVRVELDPADPV
jgi:primosomal protein N' (replication factor Y)